MSYEFRRQQRVAFDGDVDHEVDLVQVADGKGKTEESEKEVYYEEH